MSTENKDDLLQGDWTPIRNKILFSDLPPAAIKVYLGIAAHAFGKKTFAFPTLKTLSNELHMDKAQISKTIKRLSKEGLINVGIYKNRQGQPHCYQLLPPPDNFNPNYVPLKIKKADKNKITFVDNKQQTTTFVDNKQQTTTFVDNSQQTVDNSQQTVDNSQQGLGNSCPSNADEGKLDGDRNLRGRRQYNKTKESSSRVLKNSNPQEGTGKKNDDDGKAKDKNNLKQPTDISLDLPKAKELTNYTNEVLAKNRCQRLSPAAAKKFPDQMAVLLKSYEYEHIKFAVDEVCENLGHTGHPRDRKIVSANYFKSHLDKTKFSWTIQNSKQKQVMSAWEREREYDLQKQFGQKEAE